MKLLTAITDVIDTIGLSGSQTVGSLMQAVGELNNITLDESIVKQFDNLKAAVEGVASAISGGGGGGNSITDAITEMGDKAKKVIGEPGAEGDGTVIGEFGSMKTAVNEVSSAIGTGEESGGNGAGSESDNNLISSITDMGDTTLETLGEPDGDGVIGRFGEFRDTIGEAREHVEGISDGLAAIDGQEVECTIKVNIETTGGLPTFAEGTLGDMNLESGEYNARYGKAFAGGTGKYKGLPKDERNALVSEYGQTEMTVLPDGKTIITDEPTMMDLPKDTVVFNEEQTKKILDNKIDAKGVKKYPNGVIQYSDGSVKRPDGSVLVPVSLGEFIQGLSKGSPVSGNAQPGEMDAENSSLKNKYSDETIEEALKQMVTPTHIVAEHMEKMASAAEQISNMNNISNVMNKPTVTIGNIHVTCPGVTSQQVAEQVGYVIGDELNRQFNGFHNYTDQMSRVR